MLLKIVYIEDKNPRNGTTFPIIQSKREPNIHTPNTRMKYFVVESDLNIFARPILTIEYAQIENGSILPSIKPTNVDLSISPSAAMLTPFNNLPKAIDSIAASAICIITM